MLFISIVTGAQEPCYGSFSCNQATLWMVQSVCVSVGFSKVVATFNHVGGSFNLFMATTRGYLNPSFWILGLCAACWARFMCHHELWPTSVSHPFSLNSYLGFAAGNTTRKLLTISLDLFFKILPVAFLIFFAFTIWYPYFLLVGLLLQSVPLFHCREPVKYLE